MSKITCFILYLSLPLIFMGLAGCVNDVGEVLPVEDDNCIVRVKIKVPAGNSGMTRAGGYSDTHIQTIDVLSFRDDDKTFQYRTTAYAIDPAGEWFDIVLNKSRDEYQVLVVLANLKDETDDFTLTPGATTIEDLRKALTVNFIHQTTYDPTHTTHVPGQFGEDRPLPMWGESEPVTILSEQMSLGTIYMLRSLAAVTVLVNLDTNDPEQKPFQLVDVVITNTPGEGLAIPDPAILDIASDGYRTVSEPSMENLTPTYTNAYYTSIDGVSIPHGIYIGERSNTAAGIAEDDRTWLLIGGIYDNSGVVTWYRLPWIDRNGKQWDVLRNHNYIFNITKVTGAGNTEEEAKDNEIFADVIPWNLGTDAVFDIEGIYWIWIDPTFASYNLQGGIGTIHIETNYPGGWTATVSRSETDPDVPCTWITIDPASTGSELKYNVSQSAEWSIRTGYLHIQAGGFAVIVRIDQSGLYLESKNVVPTGVIDSNGEIRTVNLTGLFDNISIRVWDVTSNQEIIQSPAAVVPGNISTGNPASTTISIPAWTSDVNRTIRIQYYDKTLQDWVTIQEAIQEGYNFTVGSNLTDGSTIETSNQSYNIIISGTAWPTIYARAVIRGTQTVVGGPVTISGGTGSSPTTPITIHTYEQWADQPARIVELQWSKSNTDWSDATTLNYGNQSGSFNVTGSALEVPYLGTGDTPSRRIPLLGTTVKVTVSGTYTSGWVRVRAVEVVSGIEEASSISAITNVTSRAVDLQISPNYNYDGIYKSYTTQRGVSTSLTGNQKSGHRDIKCQYQRYINSNTGGAGTWETTWKDVDANPVQQLGYVTLKTGRVVAAQDARANGNSGSESMTWSRAMGISPIYDQDGIYYPESGRDNEAGSPVGANTATPDYTTTYNSSYGGCAAYTESNTSNNFYLPTKDEISEMSLRVYDLGEIAYDTPWNYWFNFQLFHKANNLWDEHFQSGVIDIEYANGNLGESNRNTYLNRVRCVRAK